MNKRQRKNGWMVVFRTVIVFCQRRALLQVSKYTSGALERFEMLTTKLKWFEMSTMILGLCWKLHCHTNFWGHVQNPSDRTPVRKLGNPAKVAQHPEDSFVNTVHQLAAAQWDTTFGARWSVWISHCRKRAGCVCFRHDFLMLTGVAMGWEQNTLKEECHTFHYLIQIVSLRDKRQDI